MNFDGTYPETSHSEDSVALRKADKEREAGNYPQTVVYNAHVTKASTLWSCRSRWRTWLMISSGFLLLTAIGALIVVYTIPDEEFPATEIAQSRDSLAGHIIKHVRKYYRKESLNRNLSYLQEFFKKEQERLESTDIDTFVSTLDSDFILSVPNNDYERILVSEGVQNVLNVYNSWVELLVDEEEELSSYNFQVNKQFSLYKIKTIPSTGWSQNMIQVVENQRREYLQPVQISELKNSIVFAGRVQIFSKIVDALHSLSSNKSVVSIISQVLYMDTNLTKSISMSIFATNWVFNMPVVIDLSGANATEYKQVKSSLPGRPGKHGGNFLGVGNFDVSKLSVITNGGHATSGTNGTNGRDAKGGRRPDKELRKNKHDCEAQVQEEITVNVVGEKAMMVKIYDNQTCGEKGTPGGPAGKGGQGGVVLLVNGEDFTISKGSAGKDGQPGKDGVDGKAEVKNACFFTAWKRQKRSLYDNSLIAKYDPVNGVICTDETVKLPLKWTDFKPYPVEEQPPPINVSILRESVDYFSNYTRERADNLTLYPLFPVLKTLEKSQAIVNVTTPFSLITEMRNLNSTNVDILQSFQSKVKIISDATTDLEQRQALQYLQATIRSKISVARYSSNGLYVVNIGEYLDQMIDNIRSLDIKFSRKSLNHTSVLNSQIVDGLNSIAEALDGSITEQLSTLLETHKTDQRILQVALTMAKASSVLITAVGAHICNSTKPSKYEKHLHEILDTYLELKAKYYKEYNETELEDKQFVACAEMLVHHKDCPRSNSTALVWGNFKTMDNKFIETFRVILKYEHIEEHSANAFEILHRQLRSNLAQSEQVAVSIELLRDNFANARKLLHEIRLAHQRSSAFDDILSRLDGDYVFADAVLFEAVSELKNDILTNLLRAQYFNAYVAFQQWAFPFTDTVSLTRPQASKQEIIDSIEDMKDSIAATRATIQTHDKDIKQAEFSLNSQTGPFYTWKNTDYSSAIALLFKGHKIRLAARLGDSPHLLSKQAIKFRKINLIFTGEVHNVLKDFTIEMTHSGFSHYFFRDDIHVKAGPSIPLEFSYGSSSPTVYNTVYKKIVEGDIMLSPYTTWTIQLNPMSTNDKRANFQKLENYIYNTDIHLVGEGWYVHED